MSDERLLLNSYLKSLKLPTMRAEYKSIARKCSQANAAYEDFLQQFAFHEVDTYCPVEKQWGMFKLVLEFYRKCVDATKKGVTVKEIKKLPVKDAIANMKRLPLDKFKKEYKSIKKQLDEQFSEITRTKKAPVKRDKVEG